MRSAEEIYISIVSNNRKNMPPMETAIKCIRVAREEVVLEAVKKAIFIRTKANKEAILSLIKELK